MKISKKFLFFAIFIALISFYQTFADEAETRFKYDNLVISLKKAAQPQVTEDFVVFTQNTGPGFVGIAFDFEEYKTIHTFKQKKIFDEDGNLKNSLLFFILTKPENVQTINYRLLIDGLWTADPLNPNKNYDWTMGLTLSSIDMGEPKPEITCVQDKNFARFIYNGEPGQKVRLAGTFTKWDSWIYELNETRPGFYELTIPLTKGTYYYSYYIGLNSFIDKTNPNRAYTSEGQAASVLYVN